MNEITYTVRTNTRGSISGMDSCIATVPPAVWADVGPGPAAVDVPLLGRILRRLSDDLAANIGEVLHHAQWVITTDPVVVEERGMHGNPDCVRCRPSVDQALAALRDHPEGLLVGVLYWGETA